MINLPRKLIYTSKQNINHYINGNELNKALYEALFSVVARNSKIENPSSIKLINGRILETFNRAYYLCTLAVNDPDALMYISDYHYYDNDCDAYGMALVILSLQRNKNERVQHILQNHGEDMTSLFKVIAQRFNNQGITFDMDFSIRLSQVDKLDVDWEKATRGFEREIIERLIGLGKDNTEKRTICRKIWDAYKASSRQDMPYAVVNDNFFKTLYHQWEGCGEQQTEKKKNQEAPEDGGSLGRTPKPLFAGKDGKRDDETTRREAKRFHKYLKNQELLDLFLDTKGENEVNRAFVGFYFQWEKEGLVNEKDKVSGTACYRFLKDDCERMLEIGIQEKSYCNYIRARIQKISDAEKRELMRKVRDVF